MRFFDTNHKNSQSTKTKFSTKIRQKMKYFIVFLVALMSFGASSCTKSKNIEAKVWVRGNCEQCQERIETTVQKLDGVSDAKWDVKSKILSVSYNPEKISEDAIEKATAKVGHRTEKYAADAKAHEELPECCKEGYKHE